MLKKSIVILALFNICLNTAMEAPGKSQLQGFSIIGKQHGSIDDSCGTRAQLIHTMHNKTSLIEFIYGLQSCKGHSVSRWCYQGPKQNAGKCFVGAITSTFEYNDSPDNTLSLQILLAFAINNLKELHSKQQSCKDKDKELYINAFLRPQNPIRNICQSFGLRKVDNFRIWASSLGIYDPKGLEDCYDVYLLDPSALEKAADIGKRFLLPASSITIVTNSNEASDEEDEVTVPPAAVVRTTVPISTASVTSVTRILSEVTPKIRKSPRLLARKKS